MTSQGSYDDLPQVPFLLVHLPADPLATHGAGVTVLVVVGEDQEQLLSDRDQLLALGRLGQKSGLSRSDKSRTDNSPRGLRPQAELPTQPSIVLTAGDAEGCQERKPGCVGHVGAPKLPVWGNSGGERAARGYWQG